MKVTRIVQVLLAAVALELNAAADDGIQAVVDDHPITSYDVLAPLQDIFQQYEQQSGGRTPAVQSREFQLVTNNLLELVNDQLILHEFATAGYNLPESLVDEYVQEQRERIAPDLATFTRTLQDEGMTFERFRETQRNNLILQIMRDKNVASAVIISPHKIQAYYEDHKSDYRVEDEVKLRRIMLNKNGGNSGDMVKLADEILAKLKEGTPFEEMAATYCPELKDGGDWGWWEKAALRKELSDAAFALQPGQISNVIDTPQGCYILKVEDKHTTHFRPLSEVRDDIERTLLSQERARLQQQWLERLHKKTFVTYF